MEALQRIVDACSGVLRCLAVVDIVVDEAASLSVYMVNAVYQAS